MIIVPIYSTQGAVCRPLRCIMNDLSLLCVCRPLSQARSTRGHPFLGASNKRAKIILLQIDGLRDQVCKLILLTNPFCLFCMNVVSTVEPPIKGPLFGGCPLVGGLFKLKFPNPISRS